MGSNVSQLLEMHGETTEISKDAAFAEAVPATEVKV